MQSANQTLKVDSKNAYNICNNQEDIPCSECLSFQLWHHKSHYVCTPPSLSGLLYPGMVAAASILLCCTYTSHSANMEGEKKKKRAIFIIFGIAWGQQYRLFPNLLETSVLFFPPSQNI